MTSAIRRRDEHTVRDGVRTLNRAPRIHLRGAEFVLFRGMPADGRGIEENVGPEKARDARRLRVPLIPADQHTDLCEARVPDAEAAGLLGDLTDGVDAVVVGGVSRDEVVFLVEERIVRNVHLPIHPEQRSVGIDDCRRVAIDARSLAFEDGGDEYDAELCGELLHDGGGGTGDRLRHVEALVLLRLAEIRRVEELLETDDLRAARSRFPNARDGGVDIGFGVRRVGILNDSDAKRCAGHGAKITGASTASAGDASLDDADYDVHDVRPPGATPKQ